MNYHLSTKLNIYFMIYFFDVLIKLRVWMINDSVKNKKNNNNSNCYSGIKLEHQLDKANVSWQSLFKAINRPDRVAVRKQTAGWLCEQGRNQYHSLPEMEGASGVWAYDWEGTAISQGAIGQGS